MYMYMYGGLPVQGATTIWVVVKWVLIALFLSYLIGQALMQEFQANRVYILVHSRSKSLYFLSKWILLLLFSFIYLLVGAIATYAMGGVFLHPSYDFSTDFMTFFQIKRTDFHLLTLFFLQYLVFVIISIIQLFLCIVVNKLIYSAAIHRGAYVYRYQITSRTEQGYGYDIPQSGDGMAACDRRAL